MVLSAPEHLQVGFYFQEMVGVLIMMPDFAHENRIDIWASSSVASLSDADGPTLFGKEEDGWPSPVGAAAEDSRWEPAYFFLAAGCGSSPPLEGRVALGFPERACPLEGAWFQKDTHVEIYARRCLFIGQGGEDIAQV